MLTLATIAHAHAQDAPVPDEEDAATTAARVAFHVGVACADRDDWACAVEQFETARSLRASPVIVTNYGIALVHVGRYVDASDAFAAVARDPSAPSTLREAARHEVISLDHRIGHVVITVLGPSIGLAFSVDERMIAAAEIGAPVSVDPGERVVRARRGDALIAQATVHVDPGDTTPIELTIPSLDALLDPFGDDASALASPHAQTRSHEVWDEWWFWGIVGFVVGAGVGIGVGVAASEATSSANVPVR
jgi:hypothetical protein